MMTDVQIYLAVGALAVVTGCGMALFVPTSGERAWLERQQRKTAPTRKHLSPIRRPYSALRACRVDAARRRVRIRIALWRQRQLFWGENAGALVWKLLMKSHGSSFDYYQALIDAGSDQEQRLGEAHDCTRLSKQLM